MRRKDATSVKRERGGGGGGGGGGGVETEQEDRSGHCTTRNDRVDPVLGGWPSVCVVPSWRVEFFLF